MGRIFSWLHSNNQLTMAYAPLHSPLASISWINLMALGRRPIGRPGRYAAYEAFEASLPLSMKKRPQYFQGIGIFRGARSSTVWVKIHCPHGAHFKGRQIQVGHSVEIKLGNRASFEWANLIAEKDRLQGLADRGEPLEALRTLMFAEHADDWLNRKRPVLRSFGSAKGNVYSALNPTFGDKPLNTITLGDINRWISVESETLKPATVLRHLAVLKAIMNDAVKNGLIDQNPAFNADKIRGIEPRQRFVTEEEWRKIVETAEKIEAKQEAEKEQFPQQIRGWLRHFVVWAFNSGMRRSEILALKWSNVRRMEGGPTQIEVIHTKTARPRHITCTTEMEEVLTALAKLDRLPGDERLFPVSMMTLKRSLSNLWAETKLPDVRLHDLRRTHATILMQENIDPKAIAGRLGHSGLSMLGRHYAVDRGDAEAAKKFDNRHSSKHATSKQG